MPELVALKLKAVVPIDGSLVAAGKVVTVPEELAVNLLNRGKADVATADDLEQAAPEPVPSKDDDDAAAAAAAQAKADKAAK